jgi:hypothetical protein
MLSFWFLIITFFAGSQAQCDWTVEVPQKHLTPLHSLSITETVCHNNIMVLYDNTIKLPFATYAIHTQEQMTRLLGGRKDFILDPLIPNNLQHTPNDTIYHYPYSRGHLTPSYIMSYNQSVGGPWQETYYISNILPQELSFNEGAWEKFEMNVINNLEKQPNGTKWEVYTGGFWNGKYSYKYNQDGNHDTIKDYLFWKAFCDRKACNSGMITAFQSGGKIRWSVHPINTFIPGLFPKCCPYNNNLEKWKMLLEGVTQDTVFV